MSALPGYWSAESSGVLRPAVEAYLWGEPLMPEHIAALRAYLRQWICAPVWDRNPSDEAPVILAGLRGRVEALTSRAAIEAWLERADEAGLHPL